MLITSLSNISNLNKLKKYVDGIVVYTKNFSTYFNNCLTIDEIKSVYDNKKNLMMFIDLSIMMENCDINKLSDFIDNLHGFDIYFIYADLGVHQLLKDKHIENRGIFNPLTLITNSYDANFYLRQNMLSCAVSNEIPVKDMIKISNDNENKIWLKAFGYHQMFYSKRHLIDLYAKHTNKKIDINPLNSFLKEDKRDDFYHIYQSDKGTLLFRSYIINYIDYLDSIKPKYIFLDDIFLSFNKFEKVVVIYSNYLRNLISKDIAIKEIEKLNLNINDGFKYFDTVYQKEKNYEKN